MTDKEEDSLEVNSSGKQEPEQEPESNKLSRRRFTKTGAAGAAVVMSLLNLPAFGGGDHKQCTYSLLASYNLSQSPDIHHCKLACSPRYWKYHSWDVKVPSIAASYTTCCDAFGISTQYQDDDDPFCKAIYTKNLTQILNDGCPDGYRSIGKHAVAALINASHDEVKHGCPYMASEVRSDFLEACAHYYQYRQQEGNFKKSLLRQFRNKYRDYYRLDHVACPLPA